MSLKNKIEKLKSATTLFSCKLCFFSVVGYLTISKNCHWTPSFYFILNRCARVTKWRWLVAHHQPPRKRDLQKSQTWSNRSRCCCCCRRFSPLRLTLWGSCAPFLLWSLSAMLYVAKKSFPSSAGKCSVFVYFQYSPCLASVTLQNRKTLRNSMQGQREERDVWLGIGFGEGRAS